MLLKWGTANSVWEISDEHSLSRNTNLRSTVQVYHFFLGSINFQCVFIGLHCLLREAANRLKKKNVLKNFVNFTEKHLHWSLFFNKVAERLQERCFPVKFMKFLRTPILKNIFQRLLLYCNLTTHCHLSGLLYIQYLLPHHHCYCC